MTSQSRQAYGSYGWFLMTEYSMRYHSYPVSGSQLVILQDRSHFFKIRKVHFLRLELIFAVKFVFFKIRIFEKSLF